MTGPAVRTAGDVAALVGGRVRGDAAVRLSGVATLDAAGPGDLSFLHRPEYAARAADSRAGCVIVRSEEDLPGRTVVVAGDPYRAFALAMRSFHPERRPPAGISADATVDASAQLGDGVHVGPRAVIGARCRLGAGAVVMASAVVGEGCVVGDGSVLHPGVVLYPDTVLGQRVVVHAGAVLGCDGFGYSSGADGHLKIPHAGRVVVEDDVEIGAGTCVDRAVLGQTRIGRGSKIDNLVQVGHNVTIGEDCLLVGQSGVSGSARLGDRCVLAGQAGVAGHLTLGDGARVGAKSAVLGDVPAGQTVSGIPAVAHSRWKRMAAAQQRLPELLGRVRRLEREADGQTGEHA